ncbi:RICIN domain-containing protein [Actinocorallia populi]|uniref:RICIN domain-containing protein n=1 Tax=Actinocorallia populi TaxID=2079200 RepID=UPI0013003802|nr:RICIN domain-containing protein [Actinocorallia populi]
MVLLLTMVAGALTALSAVGAPASALPIRNVMIKNYATGECLSRPEKTTNERAYIAPCSDGPRQRWSQMCADPFCFESRIFSLVDQKCISGAGTGIKTVVGVYDCWSTGGRDIWRLQVSAEPPGTFRIASYVYSNQCLDVPGRPTVDLEPCSTSPGQFWSIVSP